jgi:hypothetical protein
VPTQRLDRAGSPRCAYVTCPAPSRSAVSAIEGTEDVAAAATAVVIVWAVLILRAERRRAATAAGEGALAGPLGR